MNAREALYSNFSRNVGNPYQTSVSNLEQFNHFIAINSGINDNCFASTCFYQDKQPIFNEIFLETDNLDLSPILAVAQWYQDHSIPFIPIFSGNRGFHLRALFEPERVQPQTIKKLTEQILRETHNEGKFDTHVIGDLRRIARIPNTRRLNGLWCIPLSIEYLFSQPPIYEILNMAKSPQFIQYTFKNKKSRITEFVNDAKNEEPLVTPLSKTPKETFFLKNVLRPCIYDKLCSSNPKHMIRVSATVEMLNQGLQILQILDSFELLNWMDFDREYSRMQIVFIENKWKKGQISPYGKVKLGCTKKGSCMQCILRGE